MGSDVGKSMLQMLQVKPRLIVVQLACDHFCSSGAAAYKLQFVYHACFPTTLGVACTGAFYILHQTAVSLSALMPKKLLLSLQSFTAIFTGVLVPA